MMHLSKIKYEIARQLMNLHHVKDSKDEMHYKRIINQAYITREFKQKLRLINGEPDEAILLTCLGYTVDEHSPYYQKDLIYQIISEMVLRSFNQIFMSALSIPH